MRDPSRLRLRLSEQQLPFRGAVHHLSGAIQHPGSNPASVGAKRAHV